MSVIRMDEELNLQIPEAYRHLLPDTIIYGAPKERNATCNNCAMCGERTVLDNKTARVVGDYFSSATKCCTYHPNLPNYTVGGILQDRRAEAAEGRRRIERKIKERVEVHPTGISRSRKNGSLYANGGNGFGNVITGTPDDF